MSATSCKTSDPHPEVNAQVNSVHGKYINDKVDDRKDEIDYKIKPAITGADGSVDGSADAKALQLAESLGSVFTNPLGISFADIYQSIKDLISGDIEKVFVSLVSAQFVDFDKIGQALDVIAAALNAPIEIPFVSQLYKWITGEQLTLLDVMCLALAIPTHMGYAIYTFVTTGKAHSFAEDAKGLVEQRLTAPQFYGEAPLLRSNLAAANPQYNRAAHWAYFIFYELYTIQAGALKGLQVLNPKGAWKQKETSAVLVSLVLCTGLISKTLLFKLGLKEENWNDLDLAWNSTLFGVTAGLDLFTAVDFCFLGDEVVTRFDRFKDKSKQMAKIGCSLAGAVLLGIRIESLVNNRSAVPKLFQARDILNAVALMFTFDDTSYYVDAVGPQNAVATIVAETYFKAAAGCVHIAAIATA
jgi:hypothetical protein